MTEGWATWASYRLGDLLMFSPSTYYRLFELHNAAWWPAQLPAVALGMAAAWLGASRAVPGNAGPGSRRRGQRAVCLVLALAWSMVAAGYLPQRLATVNWAAPTAGHAFLLQAVLLLLCAASPSRSARQTAGLALIGGLALWALALAGWPLLALAAGRPLAQTEWFGLMPDPTVIATLGALLLMPGRGPLWLWPLPIIWCTVSSATLWAMQSSQAWALLAASAVALGLRLAPSHGRRDG